MDEEFDPLFWVFWGFLKYGAVRPCEDNPNSSILTIGERSVVLPSNDPALSHLDFFRFTNGKGKSGIKVKALVVLFKKNDGITRVYAIYATNSSDFFEDVKKVVRNPNIVKEGESLEDFLSDKSRRYIVEFFPPSP